MGNRKINFVCGEYYHVFNRGIEKREIFSTGKDLDRFIQSIEEFNDQESSGGIFQNSFKKDKVTKNKKLVNIVCYAFNPNHFHFLLSPLVDKGIEKFMQKLGTGYTMYFNAKHKRSGSLFQGVFKSVHVNSNEYLLHLSAYINLNNKVHQLRGETSKLSLTSWEEYVGPINSEVRLVGNNEIIMGQFKNPKEYLKFALEILPEIIERKALIKDLEKTENMFLE
jgi:putative transposase